MHSENTYLETGIALESLFLLHVSPFKSNREGKQSSLP